MKPQWTQVRSVFEAVCDLPVDRRDHELHRRCESRPDLRREVEALLRYSAGAPLWIENGSSPPTASRCAALCPGDRVGAYGIVRQIGSGGMGIVYLAERADGRFTDRVAIKTLRDHLLQKDDHRHFEAEIQTLSRLDHRHIARLRDAGVHDGLPYLIMEYVDGLPIDRYCDDHTLSLTERLRLFKGVCDAVQHAHQHLIVHRDLKPGNILVMADGTPKLLDFGIAKILGERSRELTTRPMMTPAYASPEQLHGGHLTTATDVYSLGVVLYELLSGRRPRATRTIPKGENEQEDSGPPLPPSVALTTVRAAADASGAVSLSAASISQLRGMQPQQLRRHLCGDLDAIVLKALDGDPSRRYTTIEHLTMDVDRYINGLPVHARRGRWRYRAGKFIRRHTISVTCIAVAGIATIASLVNAVQHGRSAAIQRDKAQHVIAFLKDVLAAPDPRHDGREVAVRDVLETAAAQLEDVQDMPLVRASIEAVVGTTFHSLGDLDVAESHLRVALMLRRNHGEELEVAESLDDLGHLLTSRGRYDEAGPLLREALDMRREQLGDEAAATADSLNHLAKLQHLLGDFESAKRMRTEELRIRRALHAQPHVDLASACINMAALLHATEDWAAAEQLYLEALSIYDAVLPLDHPDRSDVLNNLGMLMKAREQLSDAEIMLRQALAIRSATLGDHHPNVARTLSNLGSVLIAAGRTEEAEQALRQALDLRLTVLGEHHPDVAVSQYKLGGVLMLLEKYEDAAPLLASAGETSELVLPAGHRRTLKFLRRRALCAQHLTHYAEAEELLRSCLRQEEASEGPVDSTDTLQALLKLYDEWGRPDAADEIRHKHDM